MTLPVPQPHAPTFADEVRAAIVQLLRDPGPFASCTDAQLQAMTEPCGRVDGRLIYGPLRVQASAMLRIREGRCDTT